MIYLRNFFSGTILPPPKEWLPVLIPAAEKTAKWFSANWPVIQNGFQVLFAIKEIKWDRQQCTAVGDGHVLYGLFRASVHKAEYFAIHGKIVIVAGCSGMVAEYCQLGKAQALSRITSLFANIIALKFHMELLYDQKTDELVRKSALIGVVSNLNNIASGYLLLAGKDAGMALFFGTLGIIFQTAKVSFETLLKVWDKD